jgi:hypothetical protein
VFRYPFLILLFSAIGFAGSSKKNSTLAAQYAPATVLDIHEEETQSNYVGDNPSDAPLQSEVHIYDVSIRLDSGNYAGRYKSAFGYLPSILSSNRPVEVRLQKHVMYVRVPGDEEYKMAIVKRPRGTQRS